MGLLLPRRLITSAILEYHALMYSRTIRRGKAAAERGTVALATVGHAVVSRRAVPQQPAGIPAAALQKKAALAGKVTGTHL